MLAWFGSRQFGRLVLVLPLLLYVFVPTRNHYWDGIAFAIDVEKQPHKTQLFHPNHLLYTVWGAVLQDAVKAIGMNMRALHVMQGANAVIAGSAVLLMYKMLRRTLEPRTSQMGALLFGFSATWWRFASDVNAYVPSVSLIMASVVLSTGPNASFSRCIVAGSLHAAAMLFHQLAAVFLPVVWLFLPTSPKKIVTYYIAAVVPVVSSYLYAYGHTSQPWGVSGLARWITYHSPDSGFVFDPVKGLWLTVRGTFRLLAGGKISSFVFEPSSLVAVAMLFAAVSLLLITSVKAIRSRPEFLRSLPEDLAWLCSFGVFLTIWMPQNTFYRLFYLPALVRLIVTAVSREPFRAMLPCFVTAIGCWNYAFLAYPQSRSEFNPPLTFALQQRSQWPQGTPIVFSRFHPDLWTISYFNNQAVWISMESLDLVKLDSYREYARREGRTLWVEKVSYDLIRASPAGQAWMLRHQDADAAVDRIIGGVRFEFVPIKD